jgi:hypothetical protein
MADQNPQQAPAFDMNALMNGTQQSAAAQPAAAPPVAAQPSAPTNGSAPAFDMNALVSGQGDPTVTAKPEQHYTVPASANAGTISATPGWKQFEDRVVNMFRYANPNWRPNIQPEDREANQSGDMQLVRMQELLSPEERKNNPEAEVGLSALSGMTTPTNLAVMLGTAGFGSVKALSLVGRAIALGFSGQQAWDAIKGSKELQAAWKSGDELRTRRAFANVLISAAFAGAAAHGGITGGTETGGPTQYEQALKDRVTAGLDPSQPLSPEARQAADQIRRGFGAYDAKTQDIQNDTVPAAVAATNVPSTILGPKNKIRPSTVTTAGVEAPVNAEQRAALEGQKPSLTTRVASHLAGNALTDADAKDKAELATRDAATTQAVSTLGQRAEDLGARYQSTLDGTPLPDAKAGTQERSRFETIDEMWQHLQNLVQNNTWKKGDSISAREQAEWQDAVNRATDTYKYGIDEHNRRVDEYNQNLPEGAEPMEREQYNLADANLPEQPVTLEQLKSDVQTEKANAKSKDPAVREEARTKGLKKANDALDRWMKDHSDEISQDEWNSAKQTWAMSERYKEIAMQMRGALSNGSVNGRTLRNVETIFNNRQLRERGEVDAFKNLLGPEAYKNWQDVAGLFDTVRDPRLPREQQSWGQYALELAISAGVTGGFHLTTGLGVGPALRIIAGEVLNRAMFDPEFGSTLKSMADWLKSRPSAMAATVADIPASIRERLDSIGRAYERAKISREEGSAGAAIAPNKVGGTQTPKFGRVGLGGGTPDEQLQAHNENGGSTFDASGKNLNGADKYSVGSYPDRAETHPTLDASTLQNFRDKNADLLNQPDHAVGTWKDGDKHVLDVSRLYGDRQQAIQAGRAANQKSIYHLGTGELVDTQGTGEVPGSVKDVVGKYNQSVGKPEVQDIKTPVNPHLANAIADAYDNLKHDPKNPKVKAAYNALIKETVAQWKALEKQGYRLEVKSEDPYGLNSDTPAYDEMRDDVKNNKRIKVWDGGKPPADHPLSGVDPETGVTYNTLFRAVHDIMGHVAGENDFTQQGEENAYQRHAQSYSKEAIPALTTETRGQTSHFFNNERVRKGGTPDFVDQRAALLPERFYAHPETMEMHHWSNAPDLTETNPEFMGSGKAGREMARSKEPGFLKRTNFALEGYREPAVQGQKFHYVASANPLDYYNAEEDADGIWQKAYQEGGPTAAENAVRDAGYKGYRVGNEVASFGKVPVKSAGVELSPNASGESAASQEAINRLAAEKAQGIKRVKVLRDGREVPLIGPDAVDLTAGPGETIVKRFADGHEEIQDQGQGARYSPRDPQAEALKKMSATNDNDWMGQARAKLGPDASISQVAMEAARLKTAAGATATAAPSLEASEIATRRPTSTRVQKTNAAGQYADMAGVQAASEDQPGGGTKLGYAQKLARTVSKYSGLSFTDAELKNPKAVMEKFVNHLTDNLVALHDAMPEQMREIARQWYNTAHQMSKSLAQKYGVSHEQAAGVLAALSPQNAWDNNVALGERLLDTYKNRQNFEFSPKMEAATAKVKQGQLSKAGRGILRDIQGKTLADIANQRMPERLQKKWGAKAETKWANVKAAQQGMWVRLYDEAHNSPENAMFHPSGEVIGVSPSNRSWIGLDHIAKAIRIINDGSVENINDVMGDGNKIRNFYNNIINPDSANGHVTVDTHAVGAAHFQPFSGDDAEVQHNFGNTPKGIPGAPKHAATGMRGTYPLYAEAYRRAAKRLGLKPRELQSITWEGIRSLMGDDKKTPELKSLARDVWQKVQDRELTIKQAREMIMEQAGGFSKPSWMSDEQWDEATGAGFNPETFAAAGGGSK